MNSPRVWRVRLFRGALWASLIAAATPGSATAQDGEVRLVVREFQGSGGSRARTSAVRVLLSERGLSLVRASEVDRAARRAGVSLASEAGRAQVAQQLSLNGFIEGHVYPTERGIVLEITLFSGDGRQRQQVSFRARRASDLRGVVRREFWTTCGEAVRALADVAPQPRRAAAAQDGPRRSPGSDDRPVAGSDEPVGPAGEDALRSESRSARSSGSAGSDAPRASGARREQRALRVAEYYVGVGVSTRTLEFADDIFDTVGEYRLGVATMLETGGVYFPLRGHVAADAAYAHLGIEAHARRITVNDTLNQSGERFDSSAWSWTAALRYEYPVGQRFVLVGSLGAGRERFRVEPAGPRGPDGIDTPGIPSVTFTFLRAMLGARLALPQGVSLGLHGGWRPLLNTGDLGSADWFPRARGHGLVVGGEISYRIHRMFELRLHVEHRRYLVALRPEVGDPHVAGGALDRWLDVGLAAVVVIPSAL